MNCFKVATIPVAFFVYLEQFNHYMDFEKVMT